MSGFAGAVAVGAIALSWGIGGALTFAVGMAATVPVHAPAKRALRQVGTWALRGFLGLLRALWWVVKLPYGIAVTYLHVPTLNQAGHRFSRVQAWREGTYSMGVPA